jgi:uncharacterized DUF497 family protein
LNAASRPFAALRFDSLYIQLNNEGRLDEPKRRLNFGTHGFDLADAELLDWNNVVVVPGHPASDGRPRFRAIGLLNDELVTVVFSRLGTEAVSVISMRPASNAERKIHEDKA